MINQLPPIPQEARFDTDYLTRRLDEIFDSGTRPFSCIALEGDASDRRYFRVSFESSADSSGPNSIIVMQLAQPAEESEIDFTRILKFLRKLDLPAPELFHYDRPKGLLLLEDGGDETLEDRIRKHPAQKRARYQQAVELLARIQCRATREIDRHCPAFHLKFDVEKLMWEFDFMLEHYVAGLKNSPLKKDAFQELRQQFLPLCEILAEQPLCFTHRDYHSRNLMANGDHLMVIDFQDARMGPSQYDLASLLKDSYLRLDDGLREELIDEFIDLKEKEEQRAIDRDEYRKIFNLMSVQRNLKAVGTFAYQSVGRGNDRYLQYIAPTLAYVRQALDNDFALPKLRQTLSDLVPGLNETESDKVKR